MPQMGTNSERRGAAARRCRHDGALGSAFFGPKNCFFVRPPRASKFGALCHASSPTPCAAARAPAAASMAARAGALILQGQTNYGEKQQKRRKFLSPSHQSRVSRGAMMFTSGWPLLSSVMFTTSCDDTSKLSALSISCACDGRTMPAPSYRHGTKTEKMNPTQTNRRGGARRAWRIRLINAVCLTKAERSSGQNNAVLRNRSAAPPALRPCAAARDLRKSYDFFNYFLFKFRPARHGRAGGRLIFSSSIRRGAPEMEPKNDGQLEI